MMRLARTCLAFFFIATLTTTLACGGDGPPPPADGGVLADGGVADGGVADGGIGDGGVADGGGLDGGDTDGGSPQSCRLDYECPAGQRCRLGFCEPFVPQCTGDGGCGGSQVCLEGICLDPGFSPFLGAVIFNEVLADGTANGDPNGDGTTDAMEDEFVELVNVSNQSVDLSGWTLVDADYGTALPRHTFEPGVVLQPLDAVVVFGGGNPPASTSAVRYTVSNDTHPCGCLGLDLDDEGDRVHLLDASGLTAAVFSYGDEGGVPATSDQSLTRDPDLTGDFTPHGRIGDGGAALFTPGTRTDSAPFR